MGHPERSLSVASVEYWLGEWARWMRADSHRLGYPSRSLGIVTGGASEEFDELYERESRKPQVRSVDAAIRSLPRQMETVISHYWLSKDGYRLREELHALYVEALPLLEVEMRKRGVI